MGERLALARVVFAAISVLAALVFAGCGGGQGSGGDGGSGEGTEGGVIEAGGTTGGGELTVLAASSLTDAFGQMVGVFQEQNRGATVRTSFGSSSEVLAQIQQGAPADVFGSADEAKMDTAVKEGLVAGEPRVFARNEPVVIVPADNPAGIQNFQDLATADGQYVLAEDGAPIAEYAKDVLANADKEYGGGFEKAVLDKIVSREANVRAAANRVALGEADATFVYRSDVTQDIQDRVEVIEIPDGINVIATYPIAALEGSENPELARAWVDFVLGDEGQRILEENGFLAVR